VEVSGWGGRVLGDLQPHLLQHLHVLLGQFFDALDGGLVGFVALVTHLGDEM